MGKMSRFILHNLIEILRQDFAAVSYQAILVVISDSTYVSVLNKVHFENIPSHK